MKIVRNMDINILDLGEVLVILPKGIHPAWEAGEYHPEPVEVGGFTRFMTKAGREAVRIEPGTGYTLTVSEGSGDRTWNHWDERAPYRSHHGDVFALAVATSNGGGCWFEIGLYPSAGYESRYEARLADELAI